jgi:hypothetical protein
MSRIQASIPILERCFPTLDTHRIPERIGVEPFVVVLGAQPERIHQRDGVTIGIGVPFRLISGLILPKSTSWLMKRRMAGL